MHDWIVSLHVSIYRGNFGFRLEHMTYEEVCSHLSKMSFPAYMDVLVCPTDVDGHVGMWNQITKKIDW